MAKSNRPTRFSMPHEFWKIGVKELRMHCLFFSNHPLTCTPLSLHMPSTPCVCAPVAGDQQNTASGTLYSVRACCMLIVGTPLIHRSI